MQPNEDHELADWERDLLGHSSETAHETTQRQIAELLEPDFRSRTQSNSSPRRTEQPEPPKPAGKPDFTGVGQFSGDKHGTVYKRTRIDRHYGSQNVSIGWRGAGADPSKVPFRVMDDHYVQESYDERPSGYLGMSRELDSHWAHADADARDDYEVREDGHHQGVLMNSRKATPWKINEMYVSKEGTHIVPTLLGMAGEHSLRTTSRLPEASNDLSQHSSRMVHRLADKGVIEAPKNEHRNSIDFDEGHSSARSNVEHLIGRVRSQRDDTIEVPASDVERGGRLYRQIFRGQHAKPEPERGIGEPAPLVNVRTQAGRFQEFSHHQQLAEKYDKPKPPATQQDTLF